MKKFLTEERKIKRVMAEGFKTFKNKNEKQTVFVCKKVFLSNIKHFATKECEKLSS